MAKRGRPSTYTKKKAEDICSLTATSSKSLKTICEELGIPVGTVLEWLRVNEIFSKMYARAKEQQADFLAEEIISIADDGTNDYMTITKGDTEYNVENKEVTNRSRLRVDARKWVAAKLKPRKYSERVDVTSGGEKIKPDLSGLDNNDLALLAALQNKVKANGSSKDTTA